MSFPAGSPAAERGAYPGGDNGSSLKVHPTQIYEAIAAVAFFFVLSRIYRKERRAKGEVFLIMVMLYAAWRWVIEFARGDKRPEWGGLFYSQWISMAAFAAAGVWLFLLRKRARTPGGDTAALPSGEAAGGKPVPPPPAATKTP